MQLKVNKNMCVSNFVLLLLMWIYNYVNEKTLFKRSIMVYNYVNEKTLLKRSIMVILHINKCNPVVKRRIKKLRSSFLEIITNEKQASHNKSFPLHSHTNNSIHGGLFTNQKSWICILLNNLNNTSDGWPWFIQQLNS